MKPVIASVILAILIAACNNNSQKTSEEVTTTDTAARDSMIVQADTLLSGCYSMITNRDTASLQVQVKGNNASGSLSYNLFEKDRNDGTFEGEISNGIISGWYFYRSEGMMSVRQVAWKIGLNVLLPAIGDVMVRNDSTMFTDINKLSFDSTRVFTKVACVI